MLPSVNRNSERESNPMRSCYPNKQFFNVKSVFKFLNHGPCKIYITFLGI